MADLRRLVTATNHLQQELQEAVRMLEGGEVIPRGGRQIVPGVQAQELQDTVQQVIPSMPQRHMQYTSHPTDQSKEITPSRRPGHQTLALNASPRSCLSSLFNWKPRNTFVGKRKMQGNGARKSKRKRMQMWTHTFVCLAKTQQDILPDGEERAILQIAGLGEKRISLFASSEAHEIYQELLVAFPKLSEAGGFELLRVPEGGGKQLDVIAAPESGYSVSYLKAVIHHAKIYIRPLQQDLSLDPIKEEILSEPPKEACLNCGRKVSVISLREHVVGCKLRSTCGSSDTTDTSSLPSCSRSVAEDLIDDVKSSPTLSDDLELPSVYFLNSRDDPIIIEPVNQSVAHTDSADEPDPVLELAISISKDDACHGGPQTIAEVINSLQLKTDESAFEMVVRRSHVLDDALRRMEKITYDPKKKLKVVFVGEEGADGGGLTREFFRLVSYSMSSKYMESTGCFRHNAIAYQESVFLKLGKLAAMSLVHGGASFRIFGPTVFRCMTGKNPADLIAGINEVPDPHTREILQQIKNVCDLHELRRLAVENVDLLIECGINKPSSRLELRDKANIIQAVALHKVILGTMAELSQFCEGLTALSVSDALKNHPDLLYPYYCTEYQDTLSSDSIRKLFTEIKYSEKGTNARMQEERTYMYFVDYLDECEKVDSTLGETQLENDEENETTGENESTTRVSLKTVLAFFTGADCIPPLGYTSAVLSFNESNPYPTASTCAIQLTLPTKYTDYEQFRHNLEIAFQMHGGFGLI